MLIQVSLEQKMEALCGKHVLAAIAQLAYGRSFFLRWVRTA
jgi:hypothetical protein